MKQPNWLKAERKGLEKIKGSESYWARINNDPDFIKAKRELQARYGLPLRFDIFRKNNRAWLEWLGLDNNLELSDKRQAFFGDINRLFQEFQIPKSWHDDFLSAIAGIPSGRSLDPDGVKFEVYKDEIGELKWRCVITPETDLTNPMNLYIIQLQQKQWAGDPPQPARDKNKPRKLDWRPVYEWHKSHPLFTIEEIARKLGYTSHRVRLKFAELENKK